MIFGGDQANPDRFLKQYNRTLCEFLKDQIIFIERIIALFESDKDKAKPDESLGIESIK